MIIRSKTDRLFYMAAFAVVVILFFVWFGRMPFLGDAYYYGYHSTTWMAENGLTPIPHGEMKGEDCVGHPGYFFWLWAILMTVFGDTAIIAHIIPAICVFFSLTGIYKLGRQLAGIRVGIFSAIALLVSPVFITQGFIPLPVSAAVAAAVWAIYFYSKGNFIKASILCSVAVIMREQVLLLAGAFFFAELITNGFRKPLRLLTYCLPILVLGLTFLANYLVKGYFIQITHSISTSIDINWNELYKRIIYFSEHLLLSEWRWLPVTAGITAITSKKFPIWTTALFALSLVLTAIFNLPGIYSLLLILITVTVLIKFKRIPSPTILAMMLFILLMVIFMASVKYLTEFGLGFDLYRYVLSVYPAVIVLALWGVSKAPYRFLLPVVALLFIIVTASSNLVARTDKQYDSTLISIHHFQQIRDAADWAELNGDTIIVPQSFVPAFKYPTLGYVTKPQPVRSLHRMCGSLDYYSSYFVIVPGLDEHSSFLDSLDVNFVFRSMQIIKDSTFTNGPFTTNTYRLVNEGIPQ